MINLKKVYSLKISKARATTGFENAALKNKRP